MSTLSEGEITMASRHGFTYKITSFQDVQDHFDAIWYEFNKLCAHLALSQPCSDPPDTCKIMSGRKRSAKKAAKRGAKKR